MCDHVCVFSCDSVRYLWLHCITWIVTARSPGQQLSLNGQSQLKLGYWRPRAEQPGHQESKIKQPPLLPPKNRPPSAAGNQVNVLTEGKKKTSEAFLTHASSHDLLDLIPSDRFSWWCEIFFFNLAERNKRGQFRGHCLTPEGKINEIIITGNNEITLTQPTLEKSPPFNPLTSPADIQTITFSVVNEQVHDA